MAKNTIETTVGAPLQIGAFGLGPSSLTITGEPSFDEWEGIGEFLQRVEGAVQWWIGDWLNYGESAYGEKYSQALEVLGVPLRTLEDYASVAHRVQPTDRSVGVPWTHHRVVSKCEPAEQREWLQKAQKGTGGVPWSKARLWAERHRSERGVDEEDEVVTSSYRVILDDPGVCEGALEGATNWPGEGHARKHVTVIISDAPIPVAALRGVMSNSVLSHSAMGATLLLQASDALVSWE